LKAQFDEYHHLEAKSDLPQQDQDKLSVRRCCLHQQRTLERAENFCILYELCDQLEKYARIPVRFPIPHI